MGFFRLFSLQSNVSKLIDCDVSKLQAIAIMETKPPFTIETAKAKVQAAEDAWNTRDPDYLRLA